MAPMTHHPRPTSGLDKMASGGAGRDRQLKKKTRPKTIIENLPDISDHDESRNIRQYYATSSPTTQTGRSPSDAIVVGTEDYPIHVSDTDEDCSDVAVRGDKKRIVVEQLKIRIPKDTVAKKKPTPTTTSTKKSNLSKVADTLLEDAKTYLTTSEVLSNKSNGSTAPTESSNGGQKSPVFVDLTALSDDNDIDPVLERELEEIALHGRGGLISGTPGKAAHDDVEFGRRSRKHSMLPIKPVRPQSQSVSFVDEEDEADKGWRGLLATDEMTRKKKRRRKYLFIGLASFILLLIIIVTAVTVSKNKRTEPGDPLTPEQQRIHDVLETVTGTKTLIDPTTSQYTARIWLLYEDDAAYSLDEEGIIQRYALAVLYFATGGKYSWESNNWLDGPECGDDDGNGVWTGIKCSQQGNVRALVFDDWGLTGTLPPEVGHLYKLENLIIKNNAGLSGWIPTTFGHLASLRQLGLYNNDLSGVIPDIFEHTKALRYINVENNKIYGSIPLEISHLKNLETLILHNNRFEGIVPFDQLASTSVKYLGLSNNKFSSILERSLNNITTLEHLYLDHNQMKGHIPGHVAGLRNLKAIDLGNNLFTGSIPTEVGSISRLEYFSVNNNSFNGNLPRELALLTNLKSFNAAANKLTGTVPDVSNMINLQSLQLQENNLKGNLPESIQQLRSLEILFLSSNNFSGTIPSGISQLSKTLRGLYMSDNELLGLIPTQLCLFTSLEALFLDTNKLNGAIPTCFGELSVLRQLYLFDNQLSGSVPSHLKSLRRLTGMGLENNNIVGEMPGEVCQMVVDNDVDVWADCSDVSGEDPLLCACCSVCCPGDSCV